MKLVNKTKEQLVSDFDSILTCYSAIEFGRQASTVDVLYAYRILLGRMPDMGDELDSIYV